MARQNSSLATRHSSIRGVILAAGYGKRLRPLTILLAKPAVPFLNRPLIHYSIDLLRSAGIEEIAVNLHHASETVVEAVMTYQTKDGDPVPRIHFSHEPRILGTAGALGPLRDFLSGGDFVISNGKIYMEQDLVPAIRQHRKSGALVTLLLLPHQGREPFNPVIVNDNDEVRRFARVTEVKDFSSAFIFSGVQIVSDRLLELVPPGRAESISDLYVPLLQREPGAIRGYRCSGYWCECSLPSRYLAKSFEVLQRWGRENLLAQPFEGDLKGVVAGPAVKVGADCRLERVILWPRTRLGAGCRLRDAIICGDLELPAGTNIQKAVVTRRLENILGSIAAEGQIQDRFVVWPLR